ncbi:NAD(P)-binding protein, partial [Violaceomyces palustris]
SIPSTFTSWRFDRRGSLLKNLEKVEGQPLDPSSISEGEVIVKVHFAALNPVDWKLANLLPGFVQKLPRTVGADFSGEVVKVGKAGVGRLEVGDRVYGFIPADRALRSGRGSVSTFCVADLDMVKKVPDHLSLRDVSGVTLAGVTATTLAKDVEAEDRVLILGGTTAVGLLLIQICKALGTSLIVSTASGDKCKVVKDRGVHHVIDYRIENVEQVLAERYGQNKFDHIFDCVGSYKTYASSPNYLKPRGAHKNVGAPFTEGSNFLSSVLSFFKEALLAQLLPTFLGGIPRKYEVVRLESSLIDRFDDFVQTGRISPTVDKVFGFDQVKAAYEHLIKGRPVGKVVVQV